MHHMPQSTIPPFEDWVEGEFTATTRFAGFYAKAVGDVRATNPHPVDSFEWREWLVGYETPSGATWAATDVSRDVLED